jgi:hypothetical protein
LGHVAIADALLRAGANPGVMIPVPGGALPPYESALEYAASTPTDNGMLKLLLDHGLGLDISGFMTGKRARHHPLAVALRLQHHGRAQQLLAAGFKLPEDGGMSESMWEWDARDLIMMGLG